MYWFGVRFQEVGEKGNSCRFSLWFAFFFVSVLLFILIDFIHA